MTVDPMDILTGGSNPQSTAVDLTNHPIVQAAIEASYKQESEIAAAQWVVGVVSRGWPWQDRLASLPVMC